MKIWANLKVLNEKKRMCIPEPRVPHHIQDCMPHVLVVDRKLASNSRWTFAAVRYFWSMSIVFEWLLCLADMLFARISVAMDSGYYCCCCCCFGCYIAMGNLCRIIWVNNRHMRKWISKESNINIGVEIAVAAVVTVVSAHTTWWYDESSSNHTLFIFIVPLICECVCVCLPSR